MSQQDMNSFFQKINDEDLFYKIDMMPDGTYHTSWEHLTASDYKEIDTSSLLHRIILRVHKTNNQFYFLDFCQQYQNKVVWYGFQFKSCTRYHFQFKEEDDWFDAFFYFHSDPPSSDENILHLRNINRDIILLLQQFFHFI